MQMSVNSNAVEAARSANAQVLHVDSEPGSALALALGALSAADERCAFGDADHVLRVATQVARERLGLERVAFYVRDRKTEGFLMLGTWGTGGNGEMTDEHGSSHELGAEEAAALRGLRASGAVCVQRSRAPLFAMDADGLRQIGEGWVALTPLLVGEELVGVMYNDAAITGAPVEPKRQAAAALFCNFVALQYLTRRDAAPWRTPESKPQKSPLVQRIVLAIDQSLPLRGHQLAREFGVSPGHLARAFKREMGISLVDYRNKKRIERFHEAMQRPGSDCSLKEAALAAGFGSYAQFHRIHHKFVGSAPRRSQLAARSSAAAEERLGVSAARDAS